MNLKKKKKHLLSLVFDVALATVIQGDYYKMINLQLILQIYNANLFVTLSIILTMEEELL